MARFAFRAAALPRTPRNPATADFALVRLLTDGLLDTTFGVNGTTTTDFASGSDVLRALVMQDVGDQKEGRRRRLGGLALRRNELTMTVSALSIGAARTDSCGRFQLF